MIKNDKEYQHSKKTHAGLTKDLERMKQGLRDEGLTEDKVVLLLAQHANFINEIKDEIEEYEKAKVPRKDTDKA